MRSRVYKTVRCPSVHMSVSQSNTAAACGGFAAERRTRKISIDSAGRPAAAAPQPGPAARRSAANAGNVMLTAELTRLNRLGLLSILGLLKFWQYSLLVWNLCPDGNMHGIIYRHIGRTGLGWIDGQNSPVFRRGKSGNPKWEVSRQSPRV